MTKSCPHAGALPTYDGDFYGDEFLNDPFPQYEKLRALGPIVWMSKHKNFAVTQYDEAKQVLRNHDVFSSASGVAADDVGCAFLKGNTLASDPPLHSDLRRAMAAPLLPGALEIARSRIEQTASALIDRLIAEGSFDGMGALARHLPETIVTDLIGLPEDGRENMLTWASSSFNIIGIQNDRGREGIENIKGMRTWIETKATPDRLKKGSWTARIHDLVESKVIEPWMAPLLIRDYINPSLDTTISATGQLIWQLGKSPDQWQLLRDNPDLIPNAVNEAVRLSTPIRSFSRTLKQSHEIAGVKLPADARMMVLFASANRDERKFDNPNKFDVTRGGLEHLGFGHGIHMCVGMHLAKLELSALLGAMIEKVEFISVGEPILAINNTIHNFESLPVQFTAVQSGRHNVSHVKLDAVVSNHWLDAKIKARKVLADGIISLELESDTDVPLPAFTAGAHIDVKIGHDLIRQYSLAGDPSGTGNYRIAVLQEMKGRGGSKLLHETLHDGDIVKIGRPRNNFEIDSGDEQSVLFAGGIGITPILSMSFALLAENRDFQVHYCARRRKSMAFMEEIAASGFGEVCQFYFDDDASNLFDARQIFQTLDKTAHIYVCGPSGYMKHILHFARLWGFSEDQLHYEYFGSEIDTDGDTFVVEAVRSGKIVEVQAGETILAKLEDAGIKVQKSCESGVCGSCITDVIEGIPDHRDLVLTDIEKAENAKMTICCSRSKTRKLTLDI